MNKFSATTLLLITMSATSAHAFSFGPDMNWGPSMNWGSSPSWNTPNMNWGSAPSWNGGPVMNWGNNPWGGTPFGFGNNVFPSWGGNNYGNNGWSNFQMPSFNWQNGPGWNNGPFYGAAPGMVYQQPFPGYAYPQQPRFAAPQMPGMIPGARAVAPAMRAPLPPAPMAPAAPVPAPANVATPAPVTTATSPAVNMGTEQPVFPNPTEVPADEAPATPEKAAATQ